MPFYTDANADIRVSLDGAPYGSSWSTFSGGEGDSNTVKIAPDGNEIDIGGPQTRGDVTVAILASDQNMIWLKTFDSRRGKAIMKVAVTLKDGEGNPSLGPYTYTGTCKTVTMPDWDNSNVSPDSTKFTVVMSCNAQMA